MRRLGIVYDLRKDEVLQAIQWLRPWLEKEMETIIWYESPQDIDDTISSKVDYILVFGGDGFFLATARQLGGENTPVIGVNFGKLGFLAELTIEELRDGINQISKGNCRSTPRMMLLCEVIHKHKVIHRTLALNEGVIRAAHVSRMVYAKLCINEEQVAIYGGDGVIIATPVGSTAYSLSAGGPVLSPTLSAFVITPICPHVLTMRPLIIPSDRCIEISTVPPYDDTVFIADGQVHFNLKPEYTVRITQARQYFYLLETGQRSFFKRLQEKMVWGEGRVRI